MKLNLGCCDKHLPGYVNVDMFEPADVIADLNQVWPFADSSVDEIVADDIIEHLVSQQHTMNEAWRVLKAGAQIQILVPTTDGRGAWQDPSHVAFFNRNTFFYYTHGNAHRERFGERLGIVARFNVVYETEIRSPNNIVHLRIHLEAVK